MQVPDVSLPDFVLGQAAARGDKPALIDGPTGRTVTYGQLVDAVRRMAAGLAARGFARGDVFAILLPNCPEYAVAFYGATTAGGVVTPVNPLYTAQEIAGQLQDAGASWLLTVPPFLGAAREGAAKAGGVEVVLLGPDPADGTIAFTALLSDPAGTGGLTAPAAIDPAHDLVVLPYSSGTSGLPKGVMLTHRQVVAALCQLELGAPPVSARDTTIGLAPFFHAMGLSVILHQMLHAGGTIVTMPRPDLEQLLALVQEHRATWLVVAPPVVLALAKHPAVDAYDLSSLEWLISGAAPLGPELAEACAARLGCPVRQGYGMTETVVGIAVAPLDGGKPGSVGPLLPGTEGRLVDVATGADVAPGEVGELWVRGPQIMSGYLGNPAATAAAIDADGWLRTGDLCTIDADGHVWIVDRVKELIKYKGFQVAPAELERLLVAHPAVADAAVVGEADEAAGEIPKAFVARAGDVTADELMAYVAERVAPHKRIRAVVFVDEIPKSPTGKILRRLLRTPA